MPAINNQFYQQPSSQPIFVKGEEGAKSYPTAPGTTTMLLDSDDPVFYLKSVDNSGFPMPLRVFDYTERVQKQQNDYITRKEFEELSGTIKDLRAVLEDLVGPSKK